MSEQKRAHGIGVTCPGCELCAPKKRPKARVKPDFHAETVLFVPVTEEEDQ